MYDLPEGINDDDIEFGLGNTCTEEEFEDVEDEKIRVAEERYDNE